MIIQGACARLARSLLPYTRWFELFTLWRDWVKWSVNAATFRVWVYVIGTNIVRANFMANKFCTKYSNIHSSVRCRDVFVRGRRPRLSPQHPCPYIPVPTLLSHCDQGRRQFCAANKQCPFGQNTLPFSFLTIKYAIFVNTNNPRTLPSNLLSICARTQMSHSVSKSA
jgi:hypothetical protein